MKPKFSPGEWEVAVDLSNIGEGRWGVSAGLETAARCYGSNARENARLIAAAPDLYAACEALVYPDTVEGHNSALQVAIDRARAALQKAGRTKEGA